TKRTLAALALVASLAVAAMAAPAPARAQDLEEAGGSILSAGIGTTAGLVGGAYANLALIVLKARLGHYQHSFTEAFGWESIPILAGGGVGLAIGLWDEDRLWPWILGGTAGFAAGAVAGYLLGSVAWGDPESRWANAAIGAALGIAIGSTTAYFLARSDDDDPAAPEAASVVLPLVRVRF
ncbi:MAG TPA: glycine zipper 2TM domain-containing protein, partial [Longimicrobiales bacterium]|nr:glycine zipper 2TM domain-containing protein [Longimicrobiales bacterium]